MDFPVFGDAASYSDFGKACADYIVHAGEGVTTSCYNAVRPTGIMVYHAIPFLLTSDPVEQNHIAVLMNLMSLMVLMVSLLVIFKNLSGAVPGRNTWANCLGGAAVVLFTLILCVAYIPIRMSDIQSFACFSASVAILSSEESRRHSGVLFMAGLMAGVSVLLKQNYVVSIFFLVFFWCCFDLKNHFAVKFKYVFAYLVGVSVCLIQVAAVYYHSGVPWFYEPKAMAVYDIVNSQPYVELVAYTIPTKNSYVSYLPAEVTAFQYVAVKFYEGISKFYWSVYLGQFPAGIAPQVVVVSHAKMLYMQLVMVIIALATLATIYFKNKWIAVFSLMTTASIFLSSILLHTEHRYFLMAKVYFIVLLAIIFVKFVSKIASRLESRRAGNTATDAQALIKQ
ncbi:hypothetical protein [Pseudomonas atacamensis]|uniref:Glycosyltransferase RgtA/B/C/D-like domain-containing protein n=1 Tax=Pseudomonas iranensis TaxID=2745503 RepID=A0AAU7ERL7_9PSED